MNISFNAEQARSDYLAGNIKSMTIDEFMKEIGI